ncbi:MAG: hypothetical protein WBO16_06860 [Gammaproteobacteria bacterium]
MEIRLSARKFTRFLLGIMAVLFVLNVLSFLPMFWGREHPFGPLNFNAERSLATLFSTVLLFSCSFFALIIGLCEKRERLVRIQWLGIAVAFVLMGFDESAMIHERIGELLHNQLDTTSFLYFAWVIPYSLLVIVFAAAYLPFVIKLPGDIRKLLILSAVLYVGGAVGMELPGAARYEEHGMDVVFYMLASIEELLEMTGAIAFIYTFLSYIDRYIPNFRLSFTS